MSANENQTTPAKKRLGLGMRLESPAVLEDFATVVDSIPYPFTKEEVFEAARKIKASFSQDAVREPVMLAKVPFFVVFHEDIDSQEVDKETSEKVLNLEIKDVHSSFLVGDNQSKLFFFTEHDRYVDEKFFAFVMAAHTLAIHRHPKTFQVKVVGENVGRYAKELLEFLGLEAPKPSLKLNTTHSAVTQEGGVLNMTVSIRAKPQFGKEDHLNYLLERRYS